MSTTVTYKGNTLTTVNNQTHTLTTKGKWMEDDLTLVDVTGSSSTLITKSIAANGTYNASSDSADGYSSVTVNVPNALTVIETTDTSGGTIKNIVGVDISQDTVDAAHLLSPYTAHDASGNAIVGSYVPGSGTSSVIISEVPNSTGVGLEITTDEVAVLTTKSITLNGTYLAANDSVDGYSSVTVNVQNGASITEVQNQYGTEIVVTSAQGATPSATRHTIYFEFTDETNETVYVYYDNSFVGSAITATTPTTYGQKTVTLAQLDGVTWYSYTPPTPPTPGEWETIFSSDTVSANSDTPYNYFWLSTLSDFYPVEGVTYRITIDNIEYLCTGYSFATAGGGTVVCLGNSKYSGGSDNGSLAPFNLYNAGWGALLGDTELASDVYHSMKIEQPAS